MKINYKRTALSFLENPKSFPMHTPDGYSKPMTKGEDYKLLYGIQNQFAQEGFSNHFNKKIQYVTQPFYEAYIKSRDKLKTTVQNTAFDDSGTFIFQFPLHTQTMFYMVKSNGNKDNWMYEVFICMFTKTSQNDSFGLDVLVYLGKEDSTVMDYVWKGFEDQGRDMTWWITDLLLFKTFLKHVEVETKVIQANKKAFHIGTKYVNDTCKDVEVLDSTYFTTISRTEGFGVRGHFRFQPFGIGGKEKRLIWIDAFEKHGYTRKAKILES